MQTPEPGLDVQAPSQPRQQLATPQSAPSRVRGAVGFANEGAFLLISRPSIDLLNAVVAANSSKSRNSGTEGHKSGHEAEENGDRVTVQQFRPNIVVGSAALQRPNVEGDPFATLLPHGEDSWRGLVVTEEAHLASIISSQGLKGSANVEVSVEAGGAGREGRGIGKERPMADSLASREPTGLRFTVTGECARCGMVDLDPSTGEALSGTLAALASYRRRHADVVFGQFLALEPGSLSMAHLDSTSATKSQQHWSRSQSRSRNQVKAQLHPELQQRPIHRRSDLFRPQVKSHSDLMPSLPSKTGKQQCRRDKIG